MKLTKTDLLDFLSKVSIGGCVTQAVLEADGTVTTSDEGDELIVAGKTDNIKFSERVAFKNLGLIKKVAGKMGATKDAHINMDLADMKLCLATADEKYEFRCADPATVESLHDEREPILARKEGLEGVKLKEHAVRLVRDAISNLASDKVSLFVENKKLYIVVMDTATDSTSTVELCAFKGKEFKSDFHAKVLDDILALVGKDGAMLYAGNDSDGKEGPMIIELSSGDFFYMLSPLVSGE